MFSGWTDIAFMSLSNNDHTNLTISIVSGTKSRRVINLKGALLIRFNFRSNILRNSTTHPVAKIRSSWFKTWFYKKLSWESLQQSSFGLVTLLLWPHIGLLKSKMGFSVSHNRLQCPFHHILWNVPMCYYF